jgi:hypothetical protein
MNSRAHKHWDKRSRLWIWEYPPRDHDEEQRRLQALRRMINQCTRRPMPRAQMAETRIES